MQQAGSSGLGASHPSTANLPAGLCRGPEALPYLAGFVKLLLEPRHRHLRPAQSARRSRHVPAGPRGPSLCHPRPRRPAPLGTSPSERARSLTPHWPPPQHMQMKDQSRLPIGRLLGLCKCSAQRRPRCDVAWRQQGRKGERAGACRGREDPCGRAHRCRGGAACRWQDARLSDKRPLSADFTSLVLCIIRLWFSLHRPHFL